MHYHTTAISFFLALTFSLYSLLAGLALNRIPQHSQNNLSGMDGHLPMMKHRIIFSRQYIDQIESSDLKEKQVKI
jgi:hypothetical protein